MKIEQLYGQPMDIEWAMCDGRIFIVQARPVTALPEPRAALEWKVPRAGSQILPTKRGRIAARAALAIVRDAGLAAVERGDADRSMAQAMGLRSDSFALLTIHEYAYYEMALTAWQSARLLFTMTVRGRRMARMLRTARTRWADEARPRYAQRGRRVDRRATWPRRPRWNCSPARTRSWRRRQATM